MKDRKIKYCEKCKKLREHICRGFGNPGGLVGNARWCCLICEGEKMIFEEQNKIRVVETKDSDVKHLVIKSLIVLNIIQKYKKDKNYQEIYTEYPVTIGKVCDVYWRNNKTKEIVYFEVQKKISEKWLKETMKFYGNLEGDLVIVPLNKLDDDILILNAQIKHYIP